MKWADELGEVVSSAADIKRIVLVYQRKGKREVEVVHNLGSTTEARIFVQSGLKLTEAEITELLRGRI
jgi:hypothetical protein